jgi:hypothetical protein
VKRRLGSAAAAAQRLMSQQRVLGLLGALVLTAGIVWVGRGSQAKAPGPSSPGREQSRVVAQREGRVPPEVSTLLRQEGSAYQARLFADDEGVVLVTQTGFTFWRPGEATEAHDVPLGPTAVRQGGSLVFWRSGALRRVSLSGTNERPLTALPRAPRYLLASESRLAWIELDGNGVAALQTLSAGNVRVVDESADRVCAAVLRDAVVYWILQSQDGSWKIASVGLDGQDRLQTGVHRGRPPALLALGPDGVYFYDGSERGVRRLTFELDREEAVATNVICSPLVVSDRAVCAQVGGLFDVPHHGAVPRFLALERDGPITAVAATDDSVFWVAESGEHHLTVRSALLPGL